MRDKRCMSCVLQASWYNLSDLLKSASLPRRNLSRAALAALLFVSWSLGRLSLFRLPRRPAIMRPRIFSSVSGLGERWELFGVGKLSQLLR
ncbi:uncharacterized protein CIMG_13075 [Coccidioides immitis RS]|uniref:Uncharacterized protein n=1 Tax=Coccidioides immitis (strain RS) TaxID=246410 RepID=A0A0D8JTL0_COCIM|nr:uncharacterized protein CIMG_13075 [Coccidioides immitis RS]KJF60612.1 hypothetical protein CIMG_13075 [Coccidioides immitis RS]